MNRLKNGKEIYNIWKVFENTPCPKIQTHLKGLWIWAAWTMNFYLNILLIGKVLKGYVMGMVWLVGPLCSCWGCCAAGGDALCGWWGCAVWLVGALCGWCVRCAVGGSTVWLLGPRCDWCGWWGRGVAGGGAVWLVGARCGWWGCSVAGGGTVWLVGARCGIFVYI